MNEDLGLGKTLGLIAGVGVLVALGKLLASDEKLTFRLVLGRTLLSAALAVAACSLLAFIPGINTLALVGLSTASAVLGEQFLEKLVATKVGNTQ
ncbi:holin [Caldimonas thermodepolymerans]|uniref:Holin n=1 Tax=Caldimonas thermodepolymerans TaxID=215580 RepID=A0A2S5T8Z6_9BURK|nr:holin [Caldimonas thermodepolymerans]PPE71485.1 holin [Caldimonas thermodepolymerans]QPC30513.1 holin [Caldimonas thermodepolymerans]RDI02901.1 phage holin family 2 [Caldimonas thermodepolymerans]